MTHLNFGRNNGKPAAVTSWGLGDEGGKLRLGGGQLESWGGGVAPATPLPNILVGQLSASTVRGGQDSIILDSIDSNL